jgi:hypothetical protein
LRVISFSFFLSFFLSFVLLFRSTDSSFI